MIPIKDYNPTSRPAIIVPILIGLNVFMFLFVQPTLAGGTTEQRQGKQLEFMYCEASIPYEITRRETLSEAARAGRLGERARGTTFPAACERKNIWFSILQSMFFHGGFLHIAGNMLFLFVFGNNVEDRMGKIRFVVFYLACGLLATLAQSYTTPDSTIPMVGASGAIAGVLGAYLVMFPRARIRNLVFFFFITIIDLPAVVVLGLWFVLQLFQGVGDVTPGAGVAYMAHAGGFVAGLVLVWVFRGRGAQPRAALPYDPS